MRTADVINPCPFVQAHRFDHKSIVIRPLPDRIAIPSRLENFLWEFSAIHPDRAPDLIILVNDCNLILGLEEPNGPQVEKLDSRKADRITDLEGIVVFRDRYGIGPLSRLMLLPCF